MLQLKLIQIHLLRGLDSMRSKIDCLFGDEEPKIEKKNYAITNYIGGSWNNTYFKRINDNPVKDLVTDLPRIRQTSQFLHDSTALVRGSTQNFTSITIGKGLFCTPKPYSKDKDQALELKRAILDYWSNWSDSCHIDGQQDLSSVLRSIVASIVRDGDVLVYITTNKLGKLSIDLIPATRIETPTDPKLLKGKDIYLGVQTVKREIVGYWVKNDFEGKEGHTFFPAFDKDGKIISILLKNPNNTDRLNSYRGLPALGSCILVVDQLNKLLESELQANIIKTKQLGVMKIANSKDKSKLDNIEATKLGDVNFAVIGQSDDLSIQKGSELSNPYIDKIVKIYLQEIAMVFGISYNVLFNIMDDSSYSSNSAQRQVAWESTEIWRDYLIKNLVKPLYKLVLEFGIENGDLPEIEEYSNAISRVEFSGRPNVPLKEKDLSLIHI